MSGTPSPDAVERALALAERRLGDKRYGYITMTVGDLRCLTDALAALRSTAPTPAGVVERLLKQLEQRVPAKGRPYKSDATEPVNRDGPEAAALIRSLQSQITALRELVHESLFHLRLDERAKAYHDKAERALLTQHKDGGE